MSDPKPQRNRAPVRALIYAAAFPGLQAVAREHGYALTIHGSMATDLDLVAVPWVPEAAPPEVLAEALRETVSGFYCSRADGTPRRTPSWRPHGRRAWSIYLNPECDGPYLDVSVMALEPAAAREWVSVEYACPDEGEWTLIYVPDFGRDAGWYRGSRLWRVVDMLTPEYHREVAPTFWMHLPEPPTLETTTP